MKIILSRKGFDSSAGGCPSPIFPDGSMLALPIPDKDSKIRYQDLTWEGRCLGDLAPRLAGGKPRAHYGAHLDPDLITAMRPRAPGWRPVFGQRGPAQGHLRNNEVGTGDLFLFFGLFRDVSEAGDFIPGAPSRHILWGWLQVAEALAVDDHRGRLAWAGDHPHLSIVGDPSNTMYVAAERLTLPGVENPARRRCIRTVRIASTVDCPRQRRPVHLDPTCVVQSRGLPDRPIVSWQAKRMVARSSGSQITDGRAGAGIRAGCW